MKGAVLALLALRDRTDLGWLIDQMLASCGIRHNATLAITAEARALLLIYKWPGNIRELINALEYGCALSSDGLIDWSDLPDDIVRLRKPHALLNAGVVVTAKQAIPHNPAMQLLDEVRKGRWNNSRVARERWVDRSTIHRQIHRFGIITPKDFTEVIERHTCGGTCKRFEDSRCAGSAD